MYVMCKGCICTMIINHCNSYNSSTIFFLFIVKINNAQRINLQGLNNMATYYYLCVVTCVAIVVIHPQQVEEIS